MFISSGIMNPKVGRVRFLFENYLIVKFVWESAWLTIVNVSNCWTRSCIIMERTRRISIRWNVRLVLDLLFYSASSLKQQSTQTHYPNSEPIRLPLTKRYFYFKYMILQKRWEANKKKKKTFKNIESFTLIVLSTNNKVQYNRNVWNS